MSKIKAKLDEIRLENGKLPAFSWPGGYPLLYIDKDNAVLCADCAHQEEENIEAIDIHHEGPSEFCVECNAEIESAYGDPFSDDEKENQ